MVENYRPAGKLTENKMKKKFSAKKAFVYTTGLEIFEVNPEDAKEQKSQL